MRNIRLSPAAPDERLSFELYAASRVEEMNAWGWPEEQRQSFLAMQFRFQQQAYAAAYPEGMIRTVECGGVPVGKLHTAASAEAAEAAEAAGDREASSEQWPVLVLVDIALLPAWRNKGIGGAAIRLLQQEASERGFRKLRLTVRNDNPAARLYGRLGFVPIGQDPLNTRMEWVRPLQI